MCVHKRLGDQPSCRVNYAVCFSRYLAGDFGDFSAANGNIGQILASA